MFLTVDYSTLAAQLEELTSYVEKIEEMALKDKMTQVGSKASFEDAYSRLQESGQEFGVLFFDGNGVKKVNDTLGHQAGDELIKKIVNSVRQGVSRNSDMVYRVGGDEFNVLVMAPLEVMEEIKQRVKTQMAKDGVSAACGWAHSTECENVVELADQRMYDDKGGSSR